LSKGFIKTPEAIIAALLVFAGLYFISERVYAPILTLEQDASIFGDSLLDVLESELQRSVAVCDLRRVQYLFHTLRPPTMESKILIEQVGEVDLNTNESFASKVLTFSYNFPDYVDKNSVYIYSQTEEFLTNVDWVWFATPLIVFNDQAEKVSFEALFKNVTLTKQNVINTSIMFFWNNSLVPTNISGFDDQGNYATVNVNARIPFLEAGESGTAYVLFAVNNTTYTQIYENFTGSASGFNYTVMGTIEQTRGDIRFRALNITQTQRLYVSYSLGTVSNTPYFPITEEPNNTNVNFTIYRDKRKPCTSVSFERSPLARFYAIRKSLYDDHQSSIIELELWYPYT